MQNYNIQFPSEASAETFDELEPQQASNDTKQQSKLIIFDNEESLSQYHKKTNLSLIAFKGTVYDAQSYIQHHPGGPAYLQRYVGRVIDTPFQELGHSNSARKMFRQLDVVGYLGQHSGKEESREGVNEWIPDYSKGLIWQMAKSKELNKDTYMNFIKEAKVFFNPVKDVILSENSILEALTKTSWFVIPLVWIPVIMILSYYSITLDAKLYVPFLLLGILIWTFFEYLIHRFIFHGETIWVRNFKAILIFHFLLHGIHHAFPQDRFRLVFPVVPGLILLNFVFIPMFTALFPYRFAYPLLAGGALGYLCYDMIHYFLHHTRVEQVKGSLVKRYWSQVKQYHMRHHYKDDEKGFGVSQRLWDVIFRTVLSS
ncbi:hypothetical protein FGO68_gene8613 [Halteria grandinella]|uniref:Fatty acid 2-hydroxylase n=1 Tax=Halteria grandinella TaxID=5974 RepID=A0A8J8NMZ3_HALGN|nr:hypothetical protein FGO68_gene8613 [Halteria grandinella]